MNPGRIFYAVLLIAGLAACASPTRQYYTLLPASTVADSSAVETKASPKFAISVQPVELPEQVDRPQIVINDANAAQVTPLNSALWASPLSDEIRNALSNALSRQLGVLDIASGGTPESLPIWRINVRVQRFDSVYNERAVLDATWRLTPVHQRGKKTIICRAEVQVPVETGMSALIAGHQEALQKLAALIAAQLMKPADARQIAGVDTKGCTS
ncbi:hypothetical protein CR159_18085 [Pollutimonas subterranea]|uniref:ABC-type transport auxiliary lipoprotein component domain-containing protein n=1 Tax=Pollutimonas subterranea TaxID=2045210 RepID=A0A2N4U0A8_9BURK|nr:ABC-type transport auxiliary lipoprotein family protein [Pollutimonas subterranea]PLC48444.1 hypothetical protein CR159_18085 [Pollutimonas subterranea]